MTENASTRTGRAVGRCGNQYGHDQGRLVSAHTGKAFVSVHAGKALDVRQHISGYQTGY